MTRIAWLGMIALAAACDGPSTGDGGPTPDAGPDASMTRCQHDRDCGDTSLFCSRPRCRIGDPSADAQGCVDLGAPCEAGQTCVEASASCGRPAWCTEGREGCARPGDCDGDGAQALECGGDDCDDADGDRFPGNPEVCDAEGHDEDCDPETLGGTDADTDGFVSAACCNAVYGACGDDCDDADINVNPGATEVCDARDNDCSGAADDAPELCPGGLCAAGTCDFEGWDRTIGGPGVDNATRVAIDASGSVYVAGTMQAGGTVGLGVESAITGTGRALFVVKYQSDRTPVWSYVSAGRSSSTSASALLVSPDGSHIYLAGRTSNEDLGGGADGRDFVLELDGDGEYVREARVAWTVGAAALDPAGGLIVVGDRFVSAMHEVIVSRFSATLAPGDEYVFRAMSNFGPQHVASATAVDIGPAGQIVVGGFYRSSASLTFGATVLPPAAPINAFVAQLAPDGSPQWAHALVNDAEPARALASVADIRLRADGSILVAGHYNGTLTVGAPVGSFVGTDSNGFVLGLTSLGAPSWGVSFGGDGGDDFGRGLALTAAGLPYLVGSFSSPADFGEGTVRTPTSAGSADGFLVRYAAGGAIATRFVRYAAGGDEVTVADVAVGPGDSVVIVGNFVGTIGLGGGTASMGANDGFIVRLGS